MTEFFMAMIPRTVTAQMHKVTVRNGRPVFYDPPEIKDAKSKLTAYLSEHKPPMSLTKWRRSTKRSKNKATASVRKNAMTA